MIHCISRDKTFPGIFLILTLLDSAHADGPPYEASRVKPHVFFMALYCEKTNVLTQMGYQVSTISLAM